MPRPARSDDFLAEVLRVVATHEQKKDAAKELGVKASTLSDWLSEAERRGITGETKADREAKLSIRLARAEADLRAIHRDNETAEHIREAIYGLAARTPEPPEWLTRAATAPGKRGTPSVLWSDWHYGEVVRSQEVGGVNEFNAEIASARIQKLVDRTIDLAYNHMGRARTVYPGIVINLGGDMISGDIHEELAITNDRTPQQCINDLTDLLASGIDRMASQFGKAYVPCVVGNHGRNSRKPRMKGRVFTSHEWNIYCNLERHFRKSKHVGFDIPEEADAYYRVYGHRYLLTHGDSLGVKGGDGIIGAIGPIMRGSIKLGGSEATIGREFDTVLMGHWHQMLWLPGAIVNNSLKGFDEFARLALRAPYSRPSQALWFTHPEHGITAKWEVFLEGDRKIDPERSHEWVSVLGRA